MGSTQTRVLLALKGHLHRSMNISFISQSVGHKTAVEPANLTKVHVFHINLSD